MRRCSSCSHGGECMSMSTHRHISSFPVIYERPETERSATK
ncbi:hypothetical protein HMPREF3214_01651 [Alloscardovia omnicolens]|nr:hypothetical protein HMPREF3214_01651 [Alloscardovia omnicolens]